MNDILLTRENGLLHVVFNRPQKKNALTEEMYTGLCHGLDLAADDAVRAVLFSGAGGAFTAGNDLEDFAQRPPASLDAPVFQFLVKLASCEKPLVAAVDGLAIGIGTTMLFHCDLVYAAENAKFAVPFATLGLTPEGGSSLLFPQRMGQQRAAEKLLFGDPFDAQEAQRLGFINRLLPPGEVLPHALAQARRIIALPRGSVMGTKALLRAGERAALIEHMRTEGRMFYGRLQGPAVKEAIAAFREKRKTDFSSMD